MHHYPFHVGDYIRATAHLDLIEDCIYRRLIDLYMETELPIPNETQQVIRRLRLGSSGLILETILKEFFTLESDNCWHNSRCDSEISEFKRLAEVSRINGKLGGRPKKTQQVILSNPEITQPKPAGLQPIPNTQYPNKEHFELFWKVWPDSNRKGSKRKCLEVWKKNRFDDNADEIIKHVEVCKAAWDNPKFIPAPLVYLNQARWDGAEVTINDPFAGAI
jgi:uncharacterized protein YdaU (DUF1376 family)